MAFQRGDKNKVTTPSGKTFSSFLFTPISQNLHTQKSLLSLIKCRQFIAQTQCQQLKSVSRKMLKYQLSIKGIEKYFNGP
jgi:hypothetical protein